MTKRMCPECGKQVDPKAPLCPCGDQTIPPMSLWRYVWYGALVLMTVAIIAIVLDMMGVI